MDQVLVILLSVQGCICRLTPPGCSYNSEFATCDFQLWSPPILDADFGLQVHHLKLININGTIPAGVGVSVFNLALKMFTAIALNIFQIICHIVIGRSVLRVTDWLHTNQDGSIACLSSARLAKVPR